MYSRQIIQLLKSWQQKHSYSTYRGIYRQLLRSQISRFNGIVSDVKSDTSQRYLSTITTNCYQCLDLVQQSIHVTKVSTSRTLHISSGRRKSEPNKPRQISLNEDHSLDELDTFYSRAEISIDNGTDSVGIRNDIGHIKRTDRNGMTLSNGWKETTEETNQQDCKSQLIVPENKPSLVNDMKESESIISSLMKEVEKKGEVSALRDQFQDLEVEGDEEDLPAKVEFPKLYHLAPLVNENMLLRNLVKIGVDLSKLEKDGLGKAVIQMDFKRDIKPLLLYLHDIGIPGDRVAHVLNKYSGLLLMDLSHLKAKIMYLRSKKFSRDAIVKMIDKYPTFLHLSTVEIDRAFGFLQKQLWLTGEELRSIVSQAPKLITRDPYLIQSSLHVLQDELGFTKREIKQLVLNSGRVLTKLSVDKLAGSFYYLQDEMGIPHSQMIACPQALGVSKTVLMSRHEFLVKQGRAQYDPTLPNYVSLWHLLLTDDVEFSCDVAKASLAEFNRFLRSI